MQITNGSIKLVKPYTPTPLTNSKFNISMFDEQIPNSKVSLILYYSAPQNTSNNNNENMFDHLETSLSQALTDFYMFAGRYIRNESYIDCSDQGARYVQAEANFHLLEFLSLTWDLKVKMLNDFLPFLDMGEEIVEADDPMLYVKVTAFECGGFAIGVCCTHKVSDMLTMSTFISNWASRSQGDVLELGKYSPNFCFSNDFPKRTQTDPTPIISFSTINEIKTKVQVFSFKGKTISAIREKLVFKDNKRPSKVQIIVALLWKAMVGIDKAKEDGEPMMYVASQAVNLRNKVVPKYLDNSCGNFIGGVRAEIKNDQVDNMDLQGFLNVLHDSNKEMESDYGKLVPLEYERLVVPFMDVILFAIRKDVKFYAFMSWCRFSFHDADFGSGKPVWRSLGNIPSERYVVLMDDEEGDGIEAWVHLDETTMRQLEQDPDIKAYTF